LLGRAIARALRRGPTADSPGAAAEDPKRETPRAEQAKTDIGAALATFPCHLGDVILASSGDEAWLAGGLVFSERFPMAVLFIAPDAGGDRAVLARPRPDTSLLWLTPMNPTTLSVGREPPTSIEHENERFEYLTASSASARARRTSARRPSSRNTRRRWVSASSWSSARRARAAFVDGFWRRAPTISFPAALRTRRAEPPRRVTWTRCRARSARRRSRRGCPGSRPSAPTS